MILIAGVTILVIVGVLLYCILSSGGNIPPGPSSTTSERQIRALRVKYASLWRSKGRRAA
jgi:hypothetical protein